MADLGGSFRRCQSMEPRDSIIWKRGTVLPVKVEGVVNGGVIAMVEGLRGFVPASKLSLSYIEDLETYLSKDIEVQVIDVDQANNRLVLSARDTSERKRAQGTKLIRSPAFKVGYRYGGYRRYSADLRSVCQDWKTDCPVWYTSLRSPETVSNPRMQS